MQNVLLNKRTLSCLTIEGLLRIWKGKKKKRAIVSTHPDLSIFNLE